MGKILIPGGGGGADLDVITATAPDVRKNKVIVDKDGEPLAGVMNEQAGGTFTPGTSDRVLVPANTFVTSAIIMKGDPNLTAGNIKKNVPIFGVMGSHSGYVVTPTDLYLHGNNAYCTKLCICCRTNQYIFAIISTHTVFKKCCWIFCIKCRRKYI